MTTHPHRISRWLAVTAGTLALFAGAVDSVRADALPTKLTPGDGAVLSVRPAEVSLETSTEMSSKSGDNDLVVRDPSGAQVSTDHAAVAASHTQMSVKLPATLEVGTYTVQWFVVSADDGHAASGQWKFTYDPSKPPSDGGQPSATDAHSDEAAHEDHHSSSSESKLLMPLGAAAAAIVVVGAGLLLARKRA